MLVFRQNIILFGGGRWAKVIVKTLLNIINSESLIYIKTKKCKNSMMDWIVCESLSKRVFIFNNLNELKTKNIKVAIVANSPKDHYESASWALENNLNVLIEKPLCISKKEFLMLINIAEESQGKICAAHVFNYLSSLKIYRDYIPEMDKINEIKIQWVDPEKEIRYGEIKNTFPKIPIYLDILPHIFSIFYTIWEYLPSKIEKVNLSKGSSILYFESFINETKCKITIERSGLKRVREIEAKTKDNFFKLNFAKEPGFIESKNNVFKLENINHKYQRPLSLMLKSFLEFSHKQKCDKRLSHEFVLNFLEVCELFDKFYFAKVNELIKKLKNKNYKLSKSDFNFLNEIIQKDNYASKKEVNKIIRDLVRFLNKTDCQEFDNSLIKVFNLLK